MQLHGLPLLNADLIEVLLKIDLLDSLHDLPVPVALALGVSDTACHLLDDDKLGVRHDADLRTLDHVILGVVLDRVHPLVPQLVKLHMSIQRLREEALVAGRRRRPALELHVLAVLVDLCSVPLHDQVQDPLNPGTHVLVGHRVAGQLVPALDPERIVVKPDIVPSSHLAGLPVGHRLDKAPLLENPVDIGDLNVFSIAFALADLVQELSVKHLLHRETIRTNLLQGGCPEEPNARNNWRMSVDLKQGKPELHGINLLNWV
mmetsp:Transcript_37826/g.102370  ORF Transcript_37826/g.102370 Transcript_37826/m.102370 type:complete len:261 (-) Transcript_37826:185-967(-)